jgi:hypothetical protein
MGRVNPRVKVWFVNTDQSAWVDLISAWTKSLPKCQNILTDIAFIFEYSRKEIHFTVQYQDYAGGISWKRMMLVSTLIALQPV